MHASPRSRGILTTAMNRGVSILPFAARCWRRQRKASPARAASSRPIPRRRSPRSSKPRNDDYTAVPHLVDALDNDDPAVRFMAQETLVRLTGQDCGYRFSDPPLVRAEAIQRWIVFVRDGEVDGSAHAKGAPAERPDASKFPSQ
ncbi:MAG: hypothetical protein U0575_16735 [Phycisphaerales bacterium]